MAYIDKIKERARQDKKTIVLPETTDKRTLIAASHIIAEDIVPFVDYKSRLQEYIQTDHENTLRYVVVKEEGKPNEKIFTMQVLLDGIVLGEGVGTSKKNASQEAAKAALEKGITEVCFDRGGFLFHGRVKELADGAREAGLKF